MLNTYLYLDIKKIILAIELIKKFVFHYWKTYLEHIPMSKNIELYHLL